MHKKKLKELHMVNSSRENEPNNLIIPQYQQLMKGGAIKNGGQVDTFSKRNLPELKLAKFKSRLSSETDKESKEDSKKYSNVRRTKSRSLIKRQDVVFPKINKNRQNEFFPNHKQKNQINVHQHQTNNIRINNYNLNTNNNNNANTNFIGNIHKVKPNIPPMKTYGKPKTKNISNKTPDNISIGSTSNNNNNINSYHSHPAHLNALKIDNLSKDKDKDKIQMALDKEKEEYELMKQRLDMLQSLFQSLNSLSGGTSTTSSSPFDSLFKPKPAVEITPDILTKEFTVFTQSTINSIDEFNTETSLIKAFAYNSSQGNVRDYNEDTITATKVNNDFYFFGVYDGHGGNGCSIYLRDNLHLFIKEFTKESIYNAIIETENTFINNKALSPLKEITDSSGSCGIMAIIKDNKCFIVNVGDSRCVVFKKDKVDFYTEDHKPGANFEKERIEKAGGKIYQTPSFFPLFQNGQEIETPWRVMPGRLSVSRTFGDVEAKNEKFGGMKGVVVAQPDISEIELNGDFSMIVLGCDGIFDVMTNEDLMECAKIVMREKKELGYRELCGAISDMIIKSALAKDSFDNVSCVVVLLNLKENVTV